MEPTPAPAADPILDPEHGGSELWILLAFACLVLLVLALTNHL